jgi:sugar phosphate isomerase/epimerase
VRYRAEAQAKGGVGKRSTVEVGAMNSPFRPLAEEIRRIADAHFDFLELTLEPPGAWPIDAAEVRTLVEATGLAVVGHTAYYVPIASPFPPLRAAARRVLVAAFDAFAVIGATHVNVHPDPVTRSYPPTDVIAGNTEAVAELAEAAAVRGLTLMVENLGPAFGTAAALAPLLEAHPAVAFHLDVAHAHLGGDRLDELLAAFGDRLAHVHVSDNFGVDDLHLPLGAGSIVWSDVVARLQTLGYAGTVTLEVFSPELHHLEVSKRLWRQWWEANPT